MIPISGVSGRLVFECLDFGLRVRRSVFTCFLKPQFLAGRPGLATPSTVCSHTSNICIGSICEAARRACEISLPFARLTQYRALTIRLAPEENFRKFQRVVEAGLGSAAAREVQDFGPHSGSQILNPGRSSVVEQNGVAVPVRFNAQLRERNFLFF